uniref:Cholinergic receptor, nicotinic, alpha 7 (neuronal) n=1 Tax=Mola mola TaxID=94237 RepID=A0A3Q3XEF7_MOLML
MRMDARIFILHVLTLCCLLHGSLQGVYQRRLYQELMRNYNPLERPVSNDFHSLTVHFSFSLLQIMDVDEKNQVLTTNIWLQLYWTDFYLQWNMSDYPGVTSVRFPDNRIWRPDVLLYNSADERFDASFHTNILVKSSGYCQYLPPGNTDRCELKFGSWTHGGWSLDLQMIQADVTGYIANGEWDLVEVPGRRNERFYECCREPYPDVTFTVVMRRRTLYYGLNLLIPCVLISTLALLVFLLPADSGEKISLGITVLLSLTVFMLLVAEIMPATSDSVPLIAQYFATTMVIVGLSVVATVLVLQYHHHDPDGGHMPRWVSRSSSSCFLPCLESRLDKTKIVYIQGRGTVMTYMFEVRWEQTISSCIVVLPLTDAPLFQERVNTCRFWDPQSGVWLLLPLQWEVNMEFVKARVQRVMVRTLMLLCIFHNRIFGIFLSYK